MTAREQTPLAARLAELQIEPSELAQLVNRPLEDVEGWVKATTLGGEAAVLLRFLADATDARRRVDQLRRTHARNLRGDEWVTREVAMPYGTSDTDKVSGGVPQ